ncbi:MAG: FtsX-like permease family protein [Candidatus Limnocylindrales bacterium]
MTGLAPFAWRSLRARPLRTVLSMIGIALGVAVLFAALATNAGIDAGVNRTVADVMGQADLRVGAFEERGLSEDTIAAIRTTPGVAVAAPLLEQPTYLQQDPLAAGRAQAGAYVAPVSVIGIDPSIDGPIVAGETQGIHDLRLASGTSLPAGPAANDPSAVSNPAALDQALLPTALARALDIPVGGSITLLGASGPVPFRVVGLLAGDGPDPATAGRTVVIPIAATHSLFGPVGASWVDVGLAPGATTDGVAGLLEQRLTFEPYVLSDRADLASSLAASTSGFQAITALIAAVTLFGAAFLIFNTLSMTLAERSREIGLLRAAGTTRGQIHRLVLRQAAILGVAGSILGLVLGVGLSRLIAASVGSLGDNVPIDGPGVPPVGLVAAGVVGLLVTFAAALEPAIRAGRISPIETLRPAPAGRDSLIGHLRWLVAVLVTVGVAGLALWPLGLGSSGSTGPGSSEAARPLLVYGVLLGVTLLTPLILGPLGHLAGLPFSLVLPAEVRLSRGALVRDRKRTALTVGALTIGLAMIVALGGLAGDARNTAEGWLTDVVPGDVVATSIRPIAPDEGVAQQLAAVPGVARVSPIARFGVSFRGVRLDAAAVAGSDLAADGRLTFVAGDRRAALTALDQGGSTVVPQAVATEFGLQVGDTMAFAIGRGQAVDERVVGIVARGLPGQAGESIVLGWTDATGHFGVLGADAFAIRYASGQAASAGPAVAAVARGLALEPTPLTGIESAISAAFGRIFDLFDALAVLAVLIAGLGIVNTLTMNVYERVREIGILRATGMTRRQVWRMVVVEAGILGVVGATLGCLAGVLLGAVLGGVAGLAGAGSGLTIPWPTVGLALAFGVGIAMLAAFQPARIASRIAIVRAVQFQ